MTWQTGDILGPTNLNTKGFGSSTIFNVMDSTYGAIGDGTTDDTAAIQATVAAAVAEMGTVYLPPGTYAISDEIHITAPIRFTGAGMSNVTILRTNLTGPIIRLDSATKGMYVDGFTVRYSTAPGASDTVAIGIQTDNFFQSTLRNIQILQTYQGFGNFGTTGPWLFFSNTIDTLVIRDVYQSHIKIHVGSSGANTGNYWSNVYCNGRNYANSTVKTVNGPLVQISTSDGDTFTQLNLEYANLTSAVPRIVQIERGAMVFNGVHVEGIQCDALANFDFFGIFPGSGNVCTLTVNGLQYNAMDLGNVTTWSNLVGLQGNNISACLCGVVEKQNSVQTFGGNGIRPAWSNGVRTNNSFRLLEYQAPNLTLSTSGLQSSTGPIAHIELFNNASLNFSQPGAVPGLTSALTLGVTGAALGDFVNVSAAITTPTGFCPPIGWVSASNVVSVAWPQLSGAAADPDGSGTTYTVKVTKL